MVLERFENPTARIIQTIASIDCFHSSCAISHGQGGFFFCRSSHPNGNLHRWRRHKAAFYFAFSPLLTVHRRGFSILFEGKPQLCTSTLLNKIHPNQIERCAVSVALLVRRPSSRAKCSIACEFAILCIS